VPRAALWPAIFRWREFTLLWRGRDPAVFRAIWTSLQSAGIFFERTRVRGCEASPPSLQMAAFFPQPVLDIRVRPADESRAQQILRAILDLSSLDKVKPELAS
jgi:hypothetical protein